MRHSWVGMERYSGQQISGKHEPSRVREREQDRTARITSYTNDDEESRRNAGEKDFTKTRVGEEM